MLGSFGNLWHVGAFLAYIQEKKIEEENEVKNAIGTIFYRKEKPMTALTNAQILC